jgi:hypothetical protein
MPEGGIWEDQSESLGSDTRVESGEAIPDSEASNHANSINSHFLHCRNREQAVESPQTAEGGEIDAL